MATNVPPPPPPEYPPLGRLFAPPDESKYVLVPFGKPAQILVVDRQGGAIHTTPSSNLDALVGPAGARAKSCAVAAVVGVLSYPDDRSLVIVTSATPRRLAGEGGVRDVGVVVRTAFLPFKPNTPDQWQPPTERQASDGKEAAPAVIGAKLRAQLKEMLEAGDFFVAPGFGLTHTLARRCAGGRGGGWADADDRFVWNAAALSPLADAGDGAWLSPLVHGSVLTETIETRGVRLSVSLVARRSVEHAGTRFKTRGVNDDGGAANFVEIEQLVHVQTAHASACSSFVQVRGSAPLFWEQRGKSVNPKPRTTRSEELTLPTLRRHLDGLRARYGGLALLSLLEQRGDEAELAAALVRHIDLLRADDGGGGGGGGGGPLDVPIVSFDFHAQCKASRNDGLRHLVRALEPTLGAHAFTSASPCDGGAAPVVRRRQGGVLRTNCLDCLNRTNMAQAALALHAATAQIADSGVIVDGTAASEAQSALRRLWAETGDALSLQYTGTANLSRGTGIAEGDAKKSLMEKGFGLVEKGVRTVNRYVQEQLFDDARQSSIDCLLGGGGGPGVRSLRASGGRSLRVESEGGGDYPPLSLFIGTFNVNGKSEPKHTTDDDLRAWLDAVPTDAPPDVFAIGFQEFVDLDAKNLIRDDTARRKECEARLDTLVGDAHGERYVRVCSEQMVGVLLLVYVRRGHAAAVSHVHTEIVKCGFGVGVGDTSVYKAGNKGGVACRLTLCGTSLCFINTHLPAGHSHADERNATASEVEEGLRRGFAAPARGGPFPPPLEHDVCVWLGDLNYRIELSNEEVRPRIAAGEWRPSSPPTSS